MAQSRSPNARQGEEQAPPKLNPREVKFVAHYTVHCNGAAAARYAGYAPDSARITASQLLTKPNVQAAVEAERKKLGELHFDLANKALAKLAAMMEADTSGIFTPEGVVRDFDEWPEDCKLLLAGVEIEELWEGSGKDRRPIGNLRKVKLEAPKGIVDSILKATGQFVDRTQFLDKFGKPTDPSAAAPVVNLTIGELPKPK